MARITEAQKKANTKAFENAREALKGATIQENATSFTLDFNGRKAYGFQLNGVFLANDSEVNDLLGARKEDGKRAGGMKDAAAAYILDEVAAALPWLVIDTATLQDGLHLFAASTFADRDTDENGEEVADPKQDARKRAALRLLNTENTAARLVAGAKRAGGVATLDKLYTAATKKNAAAATIRNYIFACWSLDFEPAFTSSACGATPEAYAMAFTKASDFATIADYAAAMEATAARIMAGDFANGTHTPTK